MAEAKEPRVIEKLVRDMIPDSIRGKGETPHTYTLDIYGYKHELRRKLVEEAIEAQGASSPAELIAELADLLEVVHAIAEADEIPMLHIEWQREKRRKEHGGFKERVYLESIG
jgi:predicted house-cleaning noncanonical NTP pyrophosphatase (MazG superfamily)